MINRNGSRGCGNVEKALEVLQLPEFVGSESVRAGIYGGIVGWFSSQAVCGEAMDELIDIPYPESGKYI